MSGPFAKTCILLMILVHPRVRAAGRRYERRRGGCGVRAEEAESCIVASLDEHPVRTIRTLF
jgi:hypothetical protein